MYEFSAINFPLSTALAVLTNFDTVYFDFNSAQYNFLTSLETSSLTHGLFRNVLFSLQVFGDFPVIFLL